MTMTANHQSIYRTNQRHAKAIWEDKLHAGKDVPPVDLSEMVDMAFQSTKWKDYWYQNAYILFRDIYTIKETYPPKEIDAIDLILNNDAPILIDQARNSPLIDAPILFKAAIDLLKDPNILKDTPNILKHLLRPMEAYLTFFTIVSMNDTTPRGEIEKALIDIERIWREIVEVYPDRKYPNASLVEEVLQPKLDQSTMITREADERKPGGTLPEKSMASVLFSSDTMPDDTTASIEVPPSVGQLYLPTLERKMYLPEYLPIQVIQGVQIRGRDGVLPYGLRFFYEVGMSLAPTQRQGYYCRSLIDAAVDIGIIDRTNDDNRDKTYLRTKHKDAIRKAIELLNAIRIPYREPVGGIGGWFPFRPKNIPTRLSTKDFPIRIWVELPPDDKGGVLVEKTIVRALYQNLAQLNAYLAACVLFNRFGRNQNGGLINPTMPDPDSPRNEHRHLLHPDTGKTILDERGKPVTDIYHPAAAKVLSRVYRDEAAKYPVLEAAELMRAVYPHETYKQNKDKAKWQDNSWQAWHDIAKKGYIRIESKDNGLQILPSDKHLKLHRAIMEASKKSV